eukprot:2449564-Rhodomonas_salina.1
MRRVSLRKELVGRIGQEEHAGARGRGRGGGGGGDRHRQREKSRGKRWRKETRRGLRRGEESRRERERERECTTSVGCLPPEFRARSMQACGRVATRFEWRAQSWRTRAAGRIM